MDTRECARAWTVRSLQQQHHEQLHRDAATTTMTCTLTASPTVPATPLSHEEVHHIVIIFGDTVTRRMDQSGEATIPADRLLLALKLPIDQVTMWQQRRPIPTATSSGPQALQSELARGERLGLRGETIVWTLASTRGQAIYGVPRQQLQG